MKWRNLILYVGFVCIFAGLLILPFAETGRQHLISGMMVGWGILITIVGWVFYQRKSKTISE